MTAGDGVGFFLVVFALLLPFILFLGEPDLLQAIIERLSCSNGS